MLQLLRRLLLAWGWAVLAWSAPAMELRLPHGAWEIPPLDGELTGEFFTYEIDGAPPLQWTLKLRTPRPGVRACDVTLSGPGTALRAEALIDQQGNGTWRLHESTIDLAYWAWASLDYIGEEFRGATTSGTVTFSGDGTWRGGVMHGRARVGIREGVLDHPGRKVKIEGIDLALELDDIQQRRSAAGQSLRWRSGAFELVPFGLGHVAFSLTGDQVSVEEASVEVFGGELVLAAFGFSTARREMSVIARVVGVQVEQVLQFLPKIVSSARGRVDGSVAIHRTPAGIQIGSGSLALRADEPAEVRLAPTPGLISASLPPTVLEYYPGIGKIETGEVPLRAERLEISFMPLGDAQGRTAVLRLAGGPVDPSLRAPVDLTINVRGPLDQLIRFGMDSRVQLGGGNKPR
ncbi:MAG TPA: YdbH domain-containing protein [Opitutaceae bacterium]